MSGRATDTPSGTAWESRYSVIQGEKAYSDRRAVSDKNARLKLARVQEEWSIVEEIEERWVDLRAAYACTVNKAQGSTFDRVYIDLTDIGRCTSGDQIARMLYVAVSRARRQVFLTGDLA